jgi:hypothetical protein
MEIQILPLCDAPLLVEINNTGIPGVNRIGEPKARWLIEHAAAALLACVEDRPAGILIVLPETSNFDSDYFRWFTARYRNILYLDRVVVLEWARRHGVARRLYAEVDQLAQRLGAAIVSEVYSQPPNPVSTRFHTRCGYRQIGSQVIEGEGKVVSKLIKFPERARPVV